MPIGPAIAGWPTLSVVFMRDGVEPGEGTIAIVDSEGAVVEEIDVTDSERVFAFDMTEETLGSFNLKDGTFMTVLLNEPLKPNEDLRRALRHGHLRLRRPAPRRRT